MGEQYNAEFYKKIMEDNRFERKSNIYYQSKIDNIKDFISEWKYFCLFHDVGYTAEILSNKNKIPDISKVLKDFKNRPDNFHESLSSQNMLRQISFFGTLEIMSHILVAKLVMDLSERKIDSNNKLFNRFKKSDVLLYRLKEIIERDNKFSELDNCLKNTYKIEKIFSNHSLKLLLPIFGINNVYVIGIHRETLEVAFFSYVKDDERNLLVLKKYSKDKDINAIINNPNLILFDDFEAENFDFEYLLNNDSIFYRYFNNMHLEENDIENALSILDQKLKTEFIGISSEEKFLNFNFKVYNFLYSYYSNIYDNLNSKNKSSKSKFNDFLQGFRMDFNTPIPDQLKNLFKLDNLIHSMLQESYSDIIKNECIESLKTIEIGRRKKRKKITLKRW